MAMFETFGGASLGQKTTVGIYGQGKKKKKEATGT